MRRRWHLWKPAGLVQPSPRVIPVEGGSAKVFRFDLGINAESGELILSTRLGDVSQPCVSRESRACIRVTGDHPFGIKTFDRRPTAFQPHAANDGDDER